MSKLYSTINTSAYLGRSNGEPTMVIGKDGLDTGALLTSKDYYFRSDSNFVFIDSITSLGSASIPVDYDITGYNFRTADLSATVKAILNSNRAYMVVGIDANGSRTLLSGQQRSITKLAWTGSFEPVPGESFSYAGTPGFSFGTVGGLYVDGVSNYMWTSSKYSDILLISLNNITIDASGLKYNKPSHAGAPGGVYVGRDSFWVGNLDLSKPFLELTPRSAVAPGRVVPLPNYSDFRFPGTGNGQSLSASDVPSISMPVVQVMNYRYGGSVPMGWNIQPNVGLIARGDGASVWDAGLSLSTGRPRPMVTANPGTEVVETDAVFREVQTGLIIDAPLTGTSASGSLPGSFTVPVTQIKEKTSDVVCAVASTPRNRGSWNQYYNSPIPNISWADLRNSQTPIYYGESTMQFEWDVRVSGGNIYSFTTSSTIGFEVFLIMTSSVGLAYKVDWKVGWNLDNPHNLNTSNAMDPRKALQKIQLEIPPYTFNILELN